MPLVVPEVNPKPRASIAGIIAGPNCSTTQMVVALWPIHQVNPIQRIIVDTYQAVSGTGWRAVDELHAQAPSHVGEHAPRERVPAPDPPEPDPRDRQLQGRRAVQRRAQDDRRDAQDLLRRPTWPISATCVRVPVAVGHSEAIHVELERPMSAGRGARDPARCARHRRRRRSAQLRVPDAADRRRARTRCTSAAFASDPSHPRGLALWVVGDNLERAPR